MLIDGGSDIHSAAQDLRHNVLRARGVEDHGVAALVAIGASLDCAVDYADENGGAKALQKMAVNGARQARAPARARWFSSTGCPIRPIRAQRSTVLQGVNDDWLRSCPR